MQVADHIALAMGLVLLLEAADGFLCIYAGLKRSKRHRRALRAFNVTIGIIVYFLLG